MKRKTIIFLTVAVALSLYSCNDKNKIDEHSSRNSLDWVGTYAGILDENSSTITLNGDGSYQIMQDFQEKSKGTVIWNKEGNKISLGEEKLFFYVGENKLGQLDKIAKKQDFPTKDLFAKIDLEITGTEWKLTELFGKKIPEIIENAFIKFEKDQRQVHGNGGCNRFMGQFNIAEDNQIRFGALASTKMFCKDAMKTESDLHKALSETVRYSIEENSLFLIDKANKKIAKFIRS
ncbi:MAG: META domain-containing protein [Spirochaetales bacterium]|nr:META domain-containing protein [Spirochaetales bacterium]